MDIRHEIEDTKAQEAIALRENFEANVNNV